MKELRDAVYQGWQWPSRSYAPTCLQPYWNVRADLYEKDGLLFIGERLVVPHSERKALLQRLHMGHLEIQRCRDRAKKSFYWLGLSSDIQSEVSMCETCMRLQTTKEENHSCHTKYLNFLGTRWPWTY